MKPKLLLHVCCAPDQAYALRALAGEYDTACFFCNSNIAPVQEYLLRRDEAKRVAAGSNVPFFEDDYHPGEWEAAVAGAESTPEGGERCRRCFLERLRRTAAFCRSAGFGAFATVMSISPHKRLPLLNECGEAAADEYGVRWIPFDFKKKDGFKKSVTLSRELGLYRQDYCGCMMSRNERDERKKRTERSSHPTRPAERFVRTG